MAKRRPWVDHVLWTEGLAYGTWVRAFLGPNNFQLATAACVVPPERPVRVLCLNAQRQRLAYALAAFLHASGHTNVSVEYPDKFPPDYAPWHAPKSAPTA